jgi:alkane 1-monooxygenase
MLRYSAPFLFLIAVPALYYAGGPMATLASVGTLLALLLGAEWVAPRSAEAGWQSDETGDPAFRVLPILYIPAQLAVIAWSVFIASAVPLGAAGLASLLLSNGIIAGIFAMLAAHEMAHSKQRAHRALAFIMLMGTGNPQFRIAHIYGHHRYAGTERDAATARLGESFYGFLLRTLPQQWREAWDFEARRCAKSDLSLLQNRALRDLLCLLALYGALAFISPLGALFLLGESAVAIIVLELFNYIAHYGLARGTRFDRSYAPLGPEHSWNSSNAFSNLLIFNMGRHSDHHRKPAAAFPELAPVGGAPELPLGYAGSILLALVPPLWRRVMDARVLAIRAKSVTSLASAA